MSKTHDLRTFCKYFDPAISEEKTFDIRPKDGDFEVGDILNLLEYNHVKRVYTGRSCKFRVTYILKGVISGLHKKYCVMSIKKIEDVK